MKPRISLILALSLILGAFLITTAMGPALAREGNMKQYKEHRQQVIKGLSLPPDKAKQFEDTDQKYAKDRQQIMDDLRKAYSELQQEMKKPAAKEGQKQENTRDEGKINDLVNRITGDQDKLMGSFKSQRNDELGLLTADQKAKYLLNMKAWWEQHIGKAHK